MNRPIVRVVTPDFVLEPGLGHVDDVPDEPFWLGGTTVAAVVDGPATEAAVLRIVARGADVVLQMAEPNARFVDALRRIGNVVIATASIALDSEQRALLEHLARGLTAAEAASAMGISRRTAHRRLRSARSIVGTMSNAETIVRARCVT